MNCNEESLTTENLENARILAGQVTELKDETAESYGNVITLEAPTEEQCKAWYAVNPAECCTHPVCKKLLPDKCKDRLDVTN